MTLLPCPRRRKTWRITLIREQDNWTSSSNNLDTLKPFDITKQIQTTKKLEMATGLMDDFSPAAKKICVIFTLDFLRAYDKDNIPPSEIKCIRERYILNPEFDRYFMRHVLAACEGLCRWVRAMEVYDRVIKILSPKRAKLQEAEQELTRQLKQLSEKYTRWKQISGKLQDLNDDCGHVQEEERQGG